MNNEYGDTHMASTYYKYDELGGNGAYVPSNFTEFKVIETDILA